MAAGLNPLPWTGSRSIAHSRRSLTWSPLWRRLDFSIRWGSWNKWVKCVHNLKEGSQIQLTTGDLVGYLMLDTYIILHPYSYTAHFSDKPAAIQGKQGVIYEQMDLPWSTITSNKPSSCTHQEHANRPCSPALAKAPPGPRLGLQPVTAQFFSSTFAISKHQKWNVLPFG